MSTSSQQASVFCEFHTRKGHIASRCGPGETDYSTCKWDEFIMMKDMLRFPERYGQDDRRGGSPRRVVRERSDPDRSKSPVRTVRERAEEVSLPPAAKTTPPKPPGPRSSANTMPKSGSTAPSTRTPAPPTTPRVSVQGRGPPASKQPSGSGRSVGHGPTTTTPASKKTDSTTKSGPAPPPRSADKTFKAQVEAVESRKRDIRHDVRRSEGDIHQLDAKKRRLEAEKEELAQIARRLRQNQEELELELQESTAKRELQAAVDALNGREEQAEHLEDDEASHSSVEEVGRVEAGIVVETLETILIAKDDKGTQTEHETKVVNVVNLLAELFDLRLFERTIIKGGIRKWKRVGFETRAEATTEVPAQKPEDEFAVQFHLSPEDKI